MSLFKIEIKDMKSSNLLWPASLGIMEDLFAQSKPVQKSFQCCQLKNADWNFKNEDQKRINFELKSRPKKDISGQKSRPYCILS